MRLLQIWEYGQPTAAEESLAEALALAKQTGFDGVLVKALDGTDFMGQGIDDHEDAITSVEEAQAQAEQAHAEGLGFYVWTNPRLNVDVELEARLTGELAAVTDGVFLDVEPFAQFWGANQPEGRAAEFMAAIRATTPDAYLVLQPDPRPGRLAEIRPEEWIPQCDAIAGQHYWSDFGTDPHVELENARQLGETWNRPVFPTLPGNAYIGSFPHEAIAEFPGFVCWRLGSTPLDTLELLGGLRRPRPEPEPVPEPEPRDELQELRSAVGYLTVDLADGIEAEARRFHVRPEQLLGIVELMRKVRTDYLGA